MDIMTNGVIDVNDCTDVVAVLMAVAAAKNGAVFTVTLPAE